MERTREREEERAAPMVPDDRTKAAKESHRDWSISEVGLILEVSRLNC